MPTLLVVPFAPWLKTLRQGFIVDGLRWLGQAESQKLTQKVRESFALSCPLGMMLTHQMMELATDLLVLKRQDPIIAVGAHLPRCGLHAPGLRTGLDRWSPRLA